MASARRTRTSLNGGLSWASATPNGASVLWYACTTALGLVLRRISASDGLATQMKSAWPVRKAASRVAASGVERMMYSSMYGRPLS